MKRDPITTSTNFLRVENITPKPKRTQRGNLEAAGFTDSPEDNKRGEQKHRNIPQSMTPENLIKFYEGGGVEGMTPQLCTFTAYYLKEFLRLRSTSFPQTKPAAQEEVAESEEIPGPSV